MSAIARNAILLLFYMLIAGCTEQTTKESNWCIDRNKRIERFEACLKLLPSGPTATEYNDWAEVVESCDTISLNQAYVWRPEGCTTYLNTVANKH